MTNHKPEKQDAASQADNATRFLRKAIDASPESVVIFDEHERVVYTNPAYHRIYPNSPPIGEIAGWTMEQLIRRSVESGQVDSPSARQNPDAWVAEQLRSRRQTGKFVRETHHANGRTYLIMHHRAAGGGTLVTHTDISGLRDARDELSAVQEELEIRIEARTRELAESEARFQDFAEASADRFWEMDADLRFSWFKEARGSKRFPWPGDVIGRTRWEMVGADPDADERWAAHRADLLERKPFKDFDFYVAGENGDPIWWRASGVPLFGENGAFVGYRGIARDVTHQKLAALERDAALKNAERANRAKSTFLANMSHELRTPLNSIIGFAEMTASEIFGPHSNSKYGEYARDTAMSAQHLLSVIGDILDMTRVEQGQMPVGDDPVDVGAVIDDALTMIRGQANGKSLRVNTAVAEDLPMLLANQRVLRQILVNLLGNAVKFTPSGGEISVAARSDADGLRIVVSDTGIGIKPEDIPRVLEPFGQVRTSATVAHEGTGLGLSLSSSLVEAHGGTLSIDSQLDQGTSVTIWFPPERIAARRE